MSDQASLEGVIMRFLLAFLISLPAVVLAQSTTATSSPEKSTQSVNSQFVGAWRLVSIETVRANGEVIFPFYGRHPEGMLMYDATGWMSVQIVSDPKPTVPTAASRESFLSAPAADKVKAVDGYYAYYGTWTVDASASTVTHHIQESLYPAERGEEGVRKFAFEANRLTLTAQSHEMGEVHVRRLVWERVASGKAIPADNGLTH
jgi:lipocalin-like protein